MELQQVGRGRSPPGDGSRARRCSTSAVPSSTSPRSPAGMGVPGERVTTADELADALRRAAAEPGPHLVEAMVPPLVP